MKHQNAATWLLGLCALAGALWYWTAAPPSSALAQAPDTSYTPLAPPESYQAALRSNLKIVGDWVDQGDFASANQSQRYVAALAQLYALRSNDDKHQEAAAALKAACDKVSAALRAKNAEASKQALKDCEAAVAGLTKAPPGEKAVHKNFRSPASTQILMLLMDCSIIDAKDAKSAEEFRHLSLALAEEANVAQFLRAEAKWRKFAEETRAVALKAAEAAKKDGLDAGRTELKKIAQTCEACHQGYKR
jgi:cytochrome c556